MLHLQRKRAHTLEVAPWNVQAFRREVELVFGHGFGSFHNFLFDGGDLAVHGGSYGWRSLRLLCERRARDRGACAFSLGGRGKDEYCQQRGNSYLFHSSDPPLDLLELKKDMDFQASDAYIGLSYSYLSATSGSTRIARRAGI